MNPNKYRITLFSERTKDSIITYNYPILPEVGDMIRLIDNEVFFVKERSFGIDNSNDLLKVDLLGIMEFEEMDLPHSNIDRQMNRLKERLSRTSGIVIH